ncbi:endo mannanase, GH76 family [Diplocarpon rosae]|nr:endo mannanase, GH76 family [Diplocarpon rosae]
MRWSRVVTGSLCVLGADAAITLDLSSRQSIIDAAATAAFDMMTYYTGNRTGDVPGNLPDPYYWWECGAMFGTMINYWYYTGDTSYNAATKQALIHQAGDDFDYMPVNQSKTLGNDDQGFWGMAAMTAAETGFEDPPEGTPGWLALAQGVFNTQVPRWDNSTCGGGLRWQIFTFNSGYTYKNSISNGCFFNIAARLALYTGNQTYADYAEKAWDWMTQIGLINEKYEIFDGTQNTDNCTEKDHNKWTYNTGIFLMGSATNGSAIWKDRVDNLITASKAFYNSDGILYEPCEPGGTCNVDQRSFKAYFTRQLAATAELAPWTHDSIMKEIETSAQAAIKTCTAGATGTQCGLKWTTGTNDGSLGVGEQMAVLEVIQSNLVDQAPGWLSSAKGTGNSSGDVNAGSGSKTDASQLAQIKITTGDRVGAAILTGLVIFGVLAANRGEVELYALCINDLFTRHNSTKHPGKMSGLRILVPVKRVIDYAVKPRVNSSQTAIQTSGVKHSMNPFDELSIEESVRIREKKRYAHGVDEIVAWTCGPAKSLDVLRTAMAMGADRGVHVEVKEGEDVEPLGIAKLLKQVVDRESINLILLGKQSIDSDASQTGPMLAGLLGWSQATQASKITFEADGKSVVVEKEVDGGTETVKGKLPMVITTDLRLNEPRYASLPNIMKAKKKKVEKLPVGDTGIEFGGRLKTTKVIEPPPRQGGGKVEDVDGMVAKLKELGAI